MTATLSLAGGPGGRTAAKARQASSMTPQQAKKRTAPPSCPSDGQDVRMARAEGSAGAAPAVAGEGTQLDSSGSTGKLSRACRRHPVLSCRALAAYLPIGPLRQSRRRFYAKPPSFLNQHPLNSSAIRCLHVIRQPLVAEDMASYLDHDVVGVEISIVVVAFQSLHT
jgi:hypothetical protein